MTESDGGFDFFLSDSPVSRQILGAILTLLVAANCLAQKPQSANNPDLTLQASSEGQTPVSAPETSTITVPAGTRLSLVLTHPVDSRSTHQIDAQTIAPVIVDDKVLIPAGTFAQGKVGKLIRRGSRAEMLVQPLSLVFANGYVVSAAGPVTFESDEGTAIANPSSAAKVGIITAPAIGLGLGAAIGSAVHTTNSSTLGGQTITASSPKGLAIGSVVGLAAGGAVSLVLLARSHHFYVEEGSPIEASILQPIILSQAQISDAVSKAADQPPPMPVRPNPPPSSVQGGSSPPGPASCSAGQEWCNGQCVDNIAFVNDSSNCGRCGNRCSISESCTGGSCGCAPGYESCMGQCVNSATSFSDSLNCGHCGNSCSAGESCFGATCRKPGM